MELLVAFNGSVDKWIQVVDADFAFCRLAQEINELSGTVGEHLSDVKNGIQLLIPLLQCDVLLLGESGAD